MAPERLLYHRLKFFLALDDMDITAFAIEHGTYHQHLRNVIFRHATGVPVPDTDDNLRLWAAVQDYMARVEQPPGQVLCAMCAAAMGESIAPQI